MVNPKKMQKVQPSMFRKKLRLIKMIFSDRVAPKKLLKLKLCF